MVKYSYVETMAIILKIYIRILK